MARSDLPVIFLVAILLSISCEATYGRRVKVWRHPQEKLLVEEYPTLGRVMQEMTVMDYKEPGANTNPRSGSLITSPPPSPPAPSRL